MPTLSSARTLATVRDLARRDNLDLSVRVRDIYDELELGTRILHVVDSWLTREPELTLAGVLDGPTTALYSVAVANKLARAIGSWLAVHGGKSSTPPQPAAPRDSYALPTQTTTAALDAWGEAHGMTPYLSLRVDRMAPFMDRAVSHELYWRNWLDVRTALQLGPRDRGGLPKNVQTELRATLERIASQVATALQEEATTVRAAPQSADVGVLVHMLQHARSDLRLGAHPVRRELRDTYKTIVLTEPPTLRIEAPPSAMCVPTRSVVVDIPLQPADDTLSFRCDCGPGRLSCPARIGAVDRALDLLTEAKGPVYAEITRELAIPAWQRALTRLQRLTGTSVATEPLGWRLVSRPSGLTPEAVTYRPAKSGRGVVLTRAADSVVREVGSARDQQVHDHLAVAVASSHRVELAERASASALRALVGHPHVFLDKQVASVVEGTCEVVLRGDDTGAEAVIRHGDAELPARAFLASLASPATSGSAVRVDSDRGLVTVAPYPPRLRRAVDTLASAPATFPPEAVEGLLRVVDAWSGQVPVALSGTLRGEAVQGSDRLEVRLAAAAHGALRVSFRVRPLGHGDTFPPGEGTREPFGLIDGRRVYVSRDLDAERRLHAVAWHGLPEEPSADAELTDPESTLAWLEHLQGVEGVDLTWDSTRRWKVSSTVSAQHVRLRGRDARSWFAIDGSVEVDHDAVPLSELLAAVRERRTYIPLGKDRWARLSDTLRSQVEALARGQHDGDALTLSAVHLPLVEALVRDGATLDASAQLLGTLDKLRTADATPIHTPTGLHAELRPYQQEGHRFLARLARWAPGAFLADDMGLGKTVQALALLLDRGAEGPALVVAPTSVGFNWVREAARFAPSLRVEAWRGADRRDRLAQLGPGDVIVTSYDLVQRDAEALAAVPFATVVLDEAQAVKNAATRRWKAVAGLQRAYTVLLTGTPIENRLDELWALSALAVPGLFGDLKDFRGTWGAPVERGADDVRVALSRRMRPFLLRRTKALVAPELPERTTIDVVVPLETGERALYEAVRRGALVELRAHDDETAAQQRIRVLAALTALRRVACHPGLHDPAWTGSTSKLDRVRELVAELRAEGHRALLFSQFVGHLDKVRAALEADGVAIRYLDGSTPEAVRRAEVDAFQRGEGDVFLISLKAGGTGLNLTAATYVLHLDPWWNPAVEDQATDRAHRIGQTRAVTVYRVVAAGTVEEQILRLHEDKRRLVAGVLEGTDAGARLGTDDLLALLRGDEPADAPAPAAARIPPAPKRTKAPPPVTASAADTRLETRPDPAPTPATPGATRWTATALLEEVGIGLDADVAAGKIAASSATAYRRALRRLLERPDAGAALTSGAAFEAYVLASTPSGPVRVVGLRAARVIHGVTPRR